MICAPKPAALEVASPSNVTLRESSATSARSSSWRPASVCSTPKCVNSSAWSSVTAFPAMAVIVASSSWARSKSVEAIAMRSPTRQGGVVASVMRSAPFAAVAPRRVHPVRGAPCRSRVPPITPSTLSPMPMTSSPVARSRRRMIARCVNGDASVPTCSAPCTSTQSASKVRSRRANCRVPSIVRLASDTSRSSSTALPLGMVTAEPSAGTAPPHVAGSDHDCAGGAAFATAAGKRRAVGTTWVRNPGPFHMRAMVASPVCSK